MPHSNYGNTLSYFSSPAETEEKRKTPTIPLHCSMNAEPSSFETSEMLATFLASTPLLSESWRACNLANANPQQSFVAQQVGSVGYVAFSGVHELLLSGSSDPASSRNLVPLDSAGNDVFSQLRRRLLQNEGEEPVMVHSGLLKIFLSLYYSHPNFLNQLDALRTIRIGGAVVCRPERFGPILQWPMGIDRHIRKAKQLGRGAITIVYAAVQQGEEKDILRCMGSFCRL